MQDEQEKFAASLRRADGREEGRPLDELLVRHFAHVAAQIPGDMLGAATARLVWAAIEQGHRRDLAALTGRWVEVLQALVAEGLLARMPGARAGLAALQILGNLSPIVRRIHHRRWSLMFPELRQERSDVVQAIRDREGPS